MVSQNVSHMGSSHQIGDLECFADRKSLPWNLPTNFHSDLIATIRQRCLLFLCALLFQQSHLFPIGVVSTYNDSRKDLHRLCQIPRNCQCKWTLGFLFGSKNFCKLLSVSWEVFVLHGSGSIGWPSPAPRLHIDDCFEIHNFHWELCDLLLSSHQNFCTRYGSANASSARGPRNFGPLADLAILVFREESRNTVFTQIHTSRKRRL